MTRPTNGTLKALIASFSIVAGLTTAVFFYGILHSSVAANTNDIADHEERIDEVEDEGNETRWRLIRIETQLERIIQMMEGQDYQP